MNEDAATLAAPPVPLIVSADKPRLRVKSVGVDPHGAFAPPVHAAVEDSPSMRPTEHIFVGSKARS
jgi:hypothetical protein